MVISVLRVILYALGRAEARALVVVPLVVFLHRSSEVLLVVMLDLDVVLASSLDLFVHCSNSCSCWWLLSVDFCLSPRLSSPSRSLVVELISFHRLARFLLDAL